MVNVTKGVLVQSDPAMLSILKWIDESDESTALSSSDGGGGKRTARAGKRGGKPAATTDHTSRAILLELDDTHLLVDAKAVERLKEKVDDYTDSLSTRHTDKWG